MINAELCTLSKKSTKRTSKMDKNSELNKLNKLKSFGQVFLFPFPLLLEA